MLVEKVILGKIFGSKEPNWNRFQSNIRHKQKLTKFSDESKSVISIQKDSNLIQTKIF